MLLVHAKTTEYVLIKLDNHIVDTYEQLHFTHTIDFVSNVISQKNFEEVQAEF